MRITTTFPGITPGQLHLEVSAERPGQVRIFEPGPARHGAGAGADPLSRANAFAYLNPTAARAEAHMRFRAFNRGGDWFGISLGTASAYLKFLQEVETPSRKAFAELVESAVELGLL